MTNYIIATALLALINSAGDRLRGTGAPSYQAGAITAGTIFTLCMAYYMPNGWQVLVIDGRGFLLLVAAYVLGEAPGWGEPLGAFLSGRPMRPEDLEWWQFGPFKRNAIAALALRGMMWGLPVAGVVGYLFGFGYALVVFWSFTAAMTWAADLARAIYKDDPISWERGETIRGALVIVFIALGVGVLL